MATDTLFWEVFRSSASAMLIVGDDGVYQDANDAACAALGRARAEIVGHRQGLFTPPEHQAEIEPVWQQFLECRALGPERPVCLGGGRKRQIPGLVGAAQAPAS